MDSEPEWVEVALRDQSRPLASRVSKPVSGTTEERGVAEAPGFPGKGEESQPPFRKVLAH